MNHQELAPNYKLPFTMLFTFAMVQFVNVLDFMIMNPLGPTFEEEFGIKTSQFGFLVGIYTLTAGIAGLIVSSFIDKTRPKKAITVIFIGFLLGTLACAFAVDFTTMLLARAFTGAFGGLMSGMVMAFIGDTIPVQKRGAAIGIVMSAFSLASVIGVPFGLFLADRYSWQTPFLAVVGIGLLVFIALRAYVPDIPRPDGAGKEKRNPFSGLVAAFSVNNHRNALILTFLLMLGQFSIIPFIASYMIHNVGFSKDQLNLIYLVGGLASVGVAPLAGKLSDKYGRYPVFAIMSIVAIVPIYFITNCPPISEIGLPLILTVSSLFFICSGGRMIPANAMITSSVPMKIRGGFMSVNSSVQHLSSAFAAFISSQIVFQPIKNGPIERYEWVGYIAIFCTFIALWLGKKLKIEG